MNVLIGTDEVESKLVNSNLHVTVYFPKACRNNCPFCTSKQLYSLYPCKPDVVLGRLSALAEYKALKEFTITGGEPLADPDLLVDMLHILDGKKVYINTTALEADIAALVKITKDIDVAGVSVSRHYGSYNEDLNILPGICRDEELTNINAYLRINAVVDDSMTADGMKKVLDRWDDISAARALAQRGTDISFRYDYNKITLENLHSVDTPLLRAAGALGELLKHTHCLVCDNMWFVREGLIYRVHKGLANTRLNVCGKTLVESIVLFPDGYLATDWDRSNDGIEETLIELKKRQ